MIRITKNRTFFLLAMLSVLLLIPSSMASDFDGKVADETRKYLKDYTSLSEDEIEELIQLSIPKQPSPCPTDADFRSAVIEAMRDYLTKPAGKSKFTKEEVKDLIVFYLSREDLSKADCCYSTGAYSGMLMSDVLKKTSSCGDMCDLIEEYYHKKCNLRYDLCIRYGHPSNICSKLKEICYEVAELEYEICMLDCGEVTTTTVSTSTTTTLECAFHGEDCDNKSCCSGLKCKELGDYPDMPPKCCEPNECATTDGCFPEGTTLNTLECVDGEWVPLATTTTITEGCHTHSNPSWLDTNDYDIKVVDKGCNDSCGTEYLIEIREKYHQYCGKRLWIWAEPGITSCDGPKCHNALEAGKCYRVMIHGGAGSTCGHMITGIGNEIDCPKCDCTGEGGINYFGKPACCEGLTQISNAMPEGSACIAPNDGSGYCTKCGDGECKSPENRCNCPKDCPSKCHVHTNPSWVTDGKHTIKIVNLGCIIKGCAEGNGDSQEALIEIREGPHCGEQFWVWVDLQMARNMPDIGSCYEAEIFTTMYGSECGHVIRYLMNQIPCPECQKCVDSDGGRNYYVKGYATTDNGATKHEDVCIVGEGTGPGHTKVYILHETYCENNEIKTEAYKCPNECRDGACIKSNEPYCSAIGTRSEGWYQNGKLIKYDNCNGCHAVCKHPGTDSEGWYSSCDSELIKYDDCSGSSECLDKKTMNDCLDITTCYWDQETDSCRVFDSTKQSCSDPDNGKDYYTQAHTYGFRKHSANERDARIRTGGKDACVGDKLREHYCVDTYYIETIDVTCPAGYSCENGACVNIPLPECGDLSNCYECLGNDCEWCDRQLPWPFDSLRSYCMDGSCNAFTNCALGTCITNPSDCPGTPPTTTTSLPSTTTTSPPDTTTTSPVSTTTSPPDTTTTSPASTTTTTPITTTTTLPSPSGTVVSIEDVTVNPGESITVPIRITNADKMSTANIYLLYDKNVVIVESVSEGDLSPLTVGINNNAGITKMNWFTITEETGDFVFAYVTLKAVGSAGQESPLDLQVKELTNTTNDPLPHSVRDGVFKIIGSNTTTTTTISSTTTSPPTSTTTTAPTTTTSISTCSVEVKFDKQEYCVGDPSDITLEFRAGGQLEDPFWYQVVLYSPYYPNGAYITGLEKVSTGVYIGDGTVGVPGTRRWVVEATINRCYTTGENSFEVIDCTVTDTVVSIEDATVNPGESITVPITITDVKDIAGADIHLLYDKNVVIVESVSKGDLSPITAGIDNNAGITRMNWASATGKTGDFVFAYVTLKAVGSSGQRSQLNLDVQDLFNSNANQIPHTVKDGMFNIKGGTANTVVSIEDATVNPGETVTVPITITDVKDIAGADIHLLYDKNVVIVESVSKGDLSPITAGIDNNAGITRMNWASATGKTGDFVFAYVTLKAVGSSGQRSQLNLDVQDLFNSNANQIPHTVKDGMFNIKGGTGYNGVISGRVTNQYGNPIAGATVKTTTCPGAGCSTCATVTTNSNGYYTMNNLATGYYVVRASKTGYTSSSKSLSLGAGNCGPTTIQKTANFVLTGQSTTTTTISTGYNGVISGRVTNQYGNPIAGATVKTTTCPGAGCSTCATVTTNSNGYYTMNNLATGYYVVRASKTGYTSSSKSLSLGAGNCGPTTIQKTANFVLTGQSTTTTTEKLIPIGIYVTYSLSSGKTGPIKDARVYIDGKYIGTTPSTGSVSTEITMGPHTLVVEANGFEKYSKNLNIPDTPYVGVTVRLEESSEPTEKSCTLSGYEWTDIRASETPCDNYCSQQGHSGGTLSASGTKACAGAECAYISDFSTCTKAKKGNDGHCGCNSQFTCTCT